MIEKNGFGYSLICDICGDEVDESFMEFHDAVDYKRSDNGWKSRKHGVDWYDICPDCVNNNRFEKLR